MQFEDQKKTYEINFKFIRNAKINPVPVFELVMTKPIVASDGFDIGDIKSQQGYTGINVSKFGNIAKAVKSKKDVLIVVAPEAIEFIKKTHAEELEKLKESAKKDPEKWFWAFGGDTHEFYISPDNETGTNFREDFVKLEKVLKNKINWRSNPLEAVSKTIERGSGLYTMNGWFEVSHADLMKIYDEIVAEKDAIKAEKQNKEAEIFAKAKVTGEKQILESYSVECNDPYESCDVDNITIYAMPDGTKKEIRIHTY
jgi:hypothetical protein